MAAQWVTEGQRRAGARKSIQSARKDWPGLPQPVFDDLAEAGLRLKWNAEDQYGRSDFTGTLSDYIEMRLAWELEADFVVEQRGRRIRVGAKSPAASLTLRKVLTAGARLGRTLRETIWLLYSQHEWPEVTDQEFTTWAERTYGPLAEV